MTSTQSITNVNVLQYIAYNATESDVNLFFEALKERRKALGTVKAASVSLDATVVLSGLSPKYLNGLSGTVTVLNRSSGSIKRGSILLDEASTKKLRYSGTRYHVPADMGRYTLGGVPLSCMTVKEI